MILIIVSKLGKVSLITAPFSLALSFLLGYILDVKAVVLHTAGCTVLSY